jgi:Transposase DNA-binding/Transposase Tn5 dimerisation domain
MDWVTSEYESIQLGDKRLNARAKRLLRQLGDTPRESIPASCKSWAEIKAAYRFFDHESVTAKTLLKPHRRATLNRIKPHPVVLLVQDTTTLNYSGQKERKDLGPLQQDNVRGLFLHPTLAMTPNQECLGVVAYEQWSRKKLAHQTPQERSRQNRQRPLKEKESYRWLRGYKQATRLASHMPETQFVYIADREGDLYAIYEEAQKAFAKSSADWVIRAHYDRKLLVETSVSKPSTLKEHVRESVALGRINFRVASTNKRKKRNVTQEIFAKEVVLSAPKGHVVRAGKPVKITVIIAREVNPPVGEEALEWVLLTSVSVVNLESAMTIIQWYLCRWQIEIYFKILKSGCNIEKLQLTTKDHFDPCLALYLIIAWRILFLTMQGRTSPNLRCDCQFETVEWETVFIMVHKKKPPKIPPTLREMIKMIAQLGGFIGRKSDGEPGASVLWKGIRSMHEHIKAREVFESVFNTYG